MIFACTSCQLRFEGAGYRDVHCPACGAIAQQAPTRPCPRCELPLSSREVSDVVVDECTGCQGVFLDEATIHRVVDDKNHARAEALLAELPRTARPFTGGRMYIKCPTCSVVMNRKLFAMRSGVIVDVCKAHGTFFDAGELPAIIEFVRRGGLVPKQGAQPKAERGKPAEKASASDSDYTAAGALIELLAELFI